MNNPVLATKESTTLFLAARFVVVHRIPVGTIYFPMREKEAATEVFFGSPEILDPPPLRGPVVLSGGGSSISSRFPGTVLRLGWGWIGTLIL